MAAAPTSSVQPWLQLQPYSDTSWMSGPLPDLLHQTPFLLLSLFVHKDCIMKRLISSLFVMASLIAVTGCNTVQGIGKDVRATGSAIQRAAE